MKDIEVISNLTNIRVKVFTHNDLDGVSCALTLKKLYNPEHIVFNFEFISYSDYDKIEKFFDPENEEGAKGYDYLFITDLNIKGPEYSHYILTPYREFNHTINSPNLHKSSIFKKIFIIDHHKDSEATFRPIIDNIFNNIEYYNDMTYCASLQLYNFCINNTSRIWSKVTLGCYRDKIEDIKCWLESYLKNVNDWDLFEWKNNNNLQARDLNILFSHQKRSKFFFMQEQKDSIVFSFVKSEKTIIADALQELEKEYQKALMTSVVLNHIDEDNFEHDDIQYIVIRSDDNISMICDRIRDDINNQKIYIRYNIKYIINVSFKYGTLNFRRIGNDIDLSKIANYYGGGGHEFAAGAVIDGENDRQLKNIIMPTLKKYSEK